MEMILELFEANLSILCNSLTTDEKATISLNKCHTFPRSLANDGRQVRIHHPLPRNLLLDVVELGPLLCLANYDVPLERCKLCHKSLNMRQPFLSFHRRQLIPMSFELRQPFGNFNFPSHIDINY
jgi:hypothetical protein